MDNIRDGSGSRLIGRRRALQVIGAAAGGLVLVACGKGGGGGGGGPAAAAACAEQGNPDDKARQLRKSLQYKDQSSFPDKKCSLCAQYEAAKFGPSCGGCKLFAGGVSPEGHCLSFAPKNAAPGTAPAAPAAPAGGEPAKAPG